MLPPELEMAVWPNAGTARPKKKFPHECWSLLSYNFTLEHQMEQKLIPYTDTNVCRVQNIHVHVVFNVNIQK